MISANDQPNQFFDHKNNMVMMMTPQELVPESLSLAHDGRLLRPPTIRHSQTLISAAWYLSTLPYIALTADQVDSSHPIPTGNNAIRCELGTSSSIINIIINKIRARYVGAL
jgi:hypothetical protein